MTTGIEEVVAELGMEFNRTLAESRLSDRIEARDQPLIRDRIES